MKNIVLASNSPRRKDILSRYKIPFKVVPSNIEEKILDNKKPHEKVMSLAFQKAVDVAEKVEDGSIILAADTIVFLDGEILGKPQSQQEAIDTLSKMSNRNHSVFTGISIVKSGTNVKVLDYCETKVKFRKLDSNMINRYIATGEYKDKAGSYGIQDIGAILVEEIVGSYSNVVGLPIVKVDNMLRIYFNLNLI